VGCSKSSQQTLDASPASDASIADAGSEQTGRDAAPASGPEVATLCPGFDPSGYYKPIVAGAMPFPDGVELLVPSGTPRAMVVTDSELYWANKTSIHRVTLGDGVDKTILDRSTLSNSIDGLAVDATNLYFTEVGSAAYRVAKLPLDGSSAPVTLGGSNSPWYIAVAGDYVYYYDAGLVEIDRVPIAGGTITTLVRKVAPDLFALINGYIYFTDQVTATQDSLLRISVDAQAPVLLDGGVSSGLDGGADGLVTLASNNGGMSAFAVAGDTIYYCDDVNLTKMPVAGGTPTVLLTLPSGFTAMATAGGHLYWANFSEPCADITRAAMDGSGQTTIVHAIQEPSSFALNATHLFIMTGSNQILRVPR
jgi:hypothetical protein